MNFAFVSLFPALLAATLTTAACATEMPASGEQPFADPPAIPSFLTRAEVIAAAITWPPAAGEMDGPPAFASAPSEERTRASVMAELRAALAQGFRPASGDRA